MGDLAQLITAVTALITAISAAAGVIIAAVRSGGREARRAAEGAVAITRTDTGHDRNQLEILQGMDADEASMVMDLLRQMNRDSKKAGGDAAGRDDEEGR